MKKMILLTMLCIGFTSVAQTKNKNAKFTRCVNMKPEFF